MEMNWFPIFVIHVFMLYSIHAASGNITSTRGPPSPMKENEGKLQYLCSSKYSSNKSGASDDGRQRRWDEALRCHPGFPPWRYNLLNSSCADVRRDYNNIDENDQVYKCHTFRSKVRRVKTQTERRNVRKTRSLSDSPPELVYTFIEQAVQPGAHVSLKCSATGEPSPRFIWTLDTVNIDQNNRIAIGESSEVSGYSIAFLNITNARVEDGGLYTCKAVNIRGSVQHSARLNVYGPPYIRSIGTIKAITGSDVTLICPYYGFPISSVKWESSHGRDLSSSRISSTEGGLLIRNVDPNSDAGGYVCEVRSPGGELARRELRLHVASPPTLSPLQTAPDLKAGHRTHLTCTVISGDMPVHFSWLKDSMPISSVLQLEERAADFFSMLLFKSLTAYHGGEYTCVATNSAGSANVTTELLIKVPPWWRTEPTDVAVLLGGALNIACEAKGHPAPTVLWTKLEGGVEVSVGNWDVAPSISTGGSSSRSSGTLSISSAQTSHAGQYTCRASNGVQPDLTKTVSVTVHEPARFESPSQNVSSVRGSNVRLICSAIGASPLQIVWSRSGRTLPNQDYRMSISESSGVGGVRSVVMIERAERRDSGLYRCQASNAYGRSEQFIHLAVQEPPEAPSDVRATNVTSRLARLSWRRPYDGNSAVTGYIIQYRQILPGGARVDDAWEGIDVHNVSIASEDFNYSEGSEVFGTITGLTPGTSYLIRVFARSPLFTSQPSSSTVVTTSSEPPTSPPQAPRVLSHDPGQLVVEWQTPPKTSWNGEILGYVVIWWRIAGTNIDINTQQHINNYYEYFIKDSQFLRRLKRAQISEKESYARSYSKHLTFGNFDDYQSSDIEHATVRGASNTKYVIVGLEHYTRYSIVVKAFNGAGQGPGSVATVAVTQEAVPISPPLDVRCRALSSQSLKVEWTPPPDDKINGALLGYKLIYRPISAKDSFSAEWHKSSMDLIETRSMSGAVEVKRITALETQLMALRKAFNYSIQVLAYTNAGDGAVSPLIHCLTDDDVPSVPADVKAVPLSATSLLISWLPPLKTNGYITHYTVYYRQVGSSNSASTERVNSMTDKDSSALIGLGGSIELKKLTDRSHYEVWVTASNAAGESEHSRHVTLATSSRVPARLISFGVNVYLTRGSNVRLACASRSAAQVSWTRRPRAPARMVSTDEPHLIIDEAEPSHSGNYTCFASNAFGTDEITYQLVCLRSPYAPTLSLQYSNRDSARIVWRNEENAIDIFGYTLQYWRLGMESNDRYETAIASEANGYTIRGLACYATYGVTLVVHTSRGDSSNAKVLQVSTSDNVDADQLARTSLWSNSSAIIVDVRSVLRSARSNCPVRLLRVQYRRADSRGEWKDAHISDAHHSGEVCVCGLDAGVWWWIRVWAAPPAPSPPRAFTLFAYTTTPDGEPIARPAHFPAETADALPSDGVGGVVLTDLTTGTRTLTIVSASLATVALLSTCAVLYILVWKRHSIWSCGRDVTILESRDCVTAIVSASDGKSCSSESRGCHDYSAAPRHKLTPEDDVYEISPYATFQVGGGGQPGKTGGATGVPTAATLDHSLQFRTFGHRENDDAPHCRKHGRSRTPKDHYDKHRVDCELQQLSRYEKFQPRHRTGGSYCVPIAHQASQATASLSEVYAGESSGGSTSPPRGLHS